MMSQIFSQPGLNADALLERRGGGNTTLLSLYFFVKSFFAFIQILSLAAIMKSSTFEVDTVGASGLLVSVVMLILSVVAIVICVRVEKSYTQLPFFELLVFSLNFFFFFVLAGRASKFFEELNPKIASDKIEVAPSSFYETGVFYFHLVKHLTSLKGNAALVTIPFPFMVLNLIPTMVVSYIYMKEYNKLRREVPYELAELGGFGRDLRAIRRRARMSDLEHTHRRIDPRDEPLEESEEEKEPTTRVTCKPPVYTNPRDSVLAGPVPSDDPHPPRLPIIPPDRERYSFSSRSSTGSVKHEEEVVPLLSQSGQRSSQQRPDDDETEDNQPLDVTDEEKPSPDTSLLESSTEVDVPQDTESKGCIESEHVVQRLGSKPEGASGGSMDSFTSGYQSSAASLPECSSVPTLESSKIKGKGAASKIVKEDLYKKKK